MTTISIKDKNLEELWGIASLYGRVQIYTFDDGAFSCHIKFNTINHVELKATGYSKNTVMEAVRMAIENSQLIVSSLEQEAAKFRNLKLIS